MGFQIIPNTNVQYGLISYDQDGNERLEGGKKFSETLIQQAAGHTNIFFFCHGWKGDVLAAIRQYDLWMKALLDSTDAARASQVFPGFKAMLIGLHWPSLPWGDEELGGVGGSFAPGTKPSPEALLQMYLERFGDRPEIRGPLTVIIQEARQNASPQKLPKHVEEAYKQLCKALGICPDSDANSPHT